MPYYQIAQFFCQSVQTDDLHLITKHVLEEHLRNQLCSREGQPDTV